jgi:hypothetical protein
MSKFIETLTRSSQTAPQPIGFRTSQAALPKHRIQLVAAVTKSTPETLTDYVTGADATLLRTPGSIPAASTLKKVTSAIPDIPYGIWLEKAGQDELKKALKSGCDFIVFPADAAVVTTQDDSVGMIIQVDTSIAEGPLRTVNDLPIDAVLVTLQAEKDGHFNWHQLMLLQRFAGIITTPMLVSIPSGTGNDELQLLQDAGIDGVVIDTGPDQPPGEVSRLRQVIDSLKTTHKHQKIDALLPHTDQSAEMLAEIEEGDEDD